MRIIKTHTPSITLNGKTDAFPLTSMVNMVMNKTRMSSIQHCP